MAASSGVALVRSGGGEELQLVTGAEAELRAQRFRQRHSTVLVDRRAAQLNVDHDDGLILAFYMHLPP